MTTAVATPPVTAEHASSSRTYTAIAPSHPAGTPSKPTLSTSNHGSPNSNDGSLQHRSNDAKRSPTSLRGNHPPSKIMVKKEPNSPELPTPRRRPNKLELANNAPIGHQVARGPLTAKDGLAIQDVGIACLSPGFHTQNPTMQQQLQKSMDMQKKQRELIEARQRNAGKTPADSGEGIQQAEYPSHFTSAGPKTAGLKSGRKAPPPALSLAAASHQQFTNDRVIQSAPLNQTFTGLRNPSVPVPRQVANQPSSLSHTSHIHHVAATQTNNRLPPISDVFANDRMGPSRYGNTSPGNSSHSNIQPPLPSPGFAPPQQQPARPREYKSAEEAVQSMSGGREDLLPKIVHYGGHQPPTPPSPMPQHGAGHLATSVPSDLHRSTSARRRPRDEYELGHSSPPLGRQNQTRRPGPFGEGRDSPETQRQKKDEFIQLCARAWDLFHS